MYGRVGPAWINDAPDIKGWRAAVYTREQQQRLGVDEAGEPRADELAALKALKEDYSAQTAAEPTARGYTLPTAYDHRDGVDADDELHAALARVRAEVAALRDHLGVEEPAARASIPPRAPPATAGGAAAAMARAAAGGGRARQQSATKFDRDRSRSRPSSSAGSALAAPPPVIVEEHIPHVPIGATVGERALAEVTHEIKTQEVADGVFLHTYQNTDGPPLLVTYRVETKIEETVAIRMSFEGSENIRILPEVPGLESSRVVPPFSEKTLVCSVRQDDKYAPARVAMSMDMSFK